MKVKITVNGQEHEVEKGRWLIDVLNDLGCSIPHFCYHPGLGPDGNCRMCQVEYVSERGSRLGISCNAPVSEGLNVVTTSDTVKSARATVEEMLLLNHPLDCPICDKAGECTLQNYYMQHDMKESRQEFKRFNKNKALDIGPTMILDQERCVLCDRCVRFLRDWAGDEQLAIAGRGHKAYLAPFPGRPVDSPYSLNTVDLCPVGALTSKDFRFSSPSWFLKRVPSTCTTCSRGCSIEVDVDTRDNFIKRLRPRFNPQVNGYWICDEGRLNYKFVNSDRIREAHVDQGGQKIESSLEMGMSALRIMLGLDTGEYDEPDEKGKLIVVASANCTLEEMFALKTLVAAYGDASMTVARHVADGIGDDKLRRADRHANARGAELLGLDVIDFRPGSEANAGTDVPEGAVLLAVGFDYGISEPLAEYFYRFSKIALLASCTSRLSDMAHVVLPGLTFAEKDGLIVNFESHVQPLNPALDNLWDRTPPWAIIADVTAFITGENRPSDIAEVRFAIGEREAGLGGVDLNAVGATGARLVGQAV